MTTPSLIMARPALYVVATPIGNLGDITVRAQQILRDCDLIAAEDTRQTRKLLSHLGIQGKELVAYHDHNEAAVADVLLRRVQDEGLALALVSDAGTPAIADPGYRLVSLAHEVGVKVHPIPGPSALTALASASGLPTDRILFVGFLPPKAQAMRKEMEGWRGLAASVVFYESPRRLRKSLQLLQELYPDAELALGRELTKLHEEVVQMPVGDWEKWLTHTTLKGEAVVMVRLRASTQPAEEQESDIRSQARRRFAEGARLGDLLKEFKSSGMSRSALYQLLLEVKEEG